MLRFIQVSAAWKAGIRMRGVKMGNNGKNVRMSKRQIENRKRRQRQKRINFWAGIAVLVILLFCISNIYARLEKMQEALKRLETQSYGLLDVKSSGTGETDEKEGEEINYAGSIDVLDVEKPVERTEAEVLKRLNELGETNSVIQGISENHSQYPKDLLAALANNPEMADFAAGYLNNNGRSKGALTAAEKEQNFPLFLQWDPRWGYQPYGGSCIGLAGCGPTCLSMALFYLTRDAKFTPDKIAEYSMENGYYVEGTGTAWALMEDVPKLYGISVTKLGADENSIRATLDNGGVVICSVGRGEFTTSGHYILIYGYDSEGLIINDPNCVARSGKRWNFSDIRWQIKNIWAYMPEGQSPMQENTVSVIYQDIRESK